MEHSTHFFERGDITKTPEQEIDTARRITGLREVLDGQIEKPPQGDGYIRAYALAMRTALDYDGPISEFIYETLRRRPHFEGSYLINKIRSAMQNHLYFPLDRFTENEPMCHRTTLTVDDKPLTYPHDFTTPDIWLQAFEAILDDPDTFGEFIVDVWTRPLTSNVSDRYKAVKLFGTAATLLGRIDNMALTDLGCSQEAGGKQLVSGLPFETVTVLRNGSHATAVHVPQTKAVNQLMNLPLEFEYVSNVDMMDPREGRSWARSCSHYPSELMDPGRVRLYDQLISSTYANMSFYRGDVTDFDVSDFNIADQRKRTAYLMGKFTDEIQTLAGSLPAEEINRRTDEAKQKAVERAQQRPIVSLITMLYQATPEERKIMIANAKSLATEFVLVQDFARINPDRPSELLFRHNWQDDPFPYRTFVLDVRENRQVWHELFRWRNGRCREMTLGLGRIALQDGRSASIWSAMRAVQDITN